MDYTNTIQELREISEHKSATDLYHTLTIEDTVEQNNNNNTNNNNNNTLVGFKSIDNICARLKLSVDNKDLSPIRQEESQLKQEELETLANQTTMLFCNQKEQNEMNENHVLDQSPINSEDNDSHIPDDSETLSNEDGSYEQASVIVIPPDCDENIDQISDKCDLDMDEKSQQSQFDDDNNKNMQEQKLNSQTNQGTNNHKLKPRNSTHYNSWHYTDMIEAIKAVQTKNLSMTAAAKRFGIPRTTLRHYLNDGTNKESKRAGFCLPKPQENTLVEYALQNRSLPEKQLYKFIFDRAKDLSRELSTLKGEEERRIVPTPAWIRRFVYRQKRLHDLFPTLLSKFEHPLHGGRKSPTDLDMSYESNYDRERGVPFDKVSMVSPRRLSTEIIFPNKSSPEQIQHRYDMHSPNSPSEQHLGYELSKSPEKQQYHHHHPQSHHHHHHQQQQAQQHQQRQEYKSRAHSDEYMSSDTSPTMKQFPVLPTTTTSSLNNSLDKDIVGDYWHRERGSKRNRTPYHHQRSNESEHGRLYPSKDVPRLPHKDQLPLLIDPNNPGEQPHYNRSPTSRYNSDCPSMNSIGRYHVDEIGHHRSEKRDLHRPSSKPFNRTSPYMNGGLLTPEGNSFSSSHDFHPSKPRYGSPLYSSDENISTHSPVLQNGMSESKSSVEVLCLRKSLEALECELGKSYIKLFNERYQQNRKLERLYSKWVALKSDLDRSQTINDLMHTHLNYEKNARGKMLYTHSP